MGRFFEKITQWFGNEPEQESEKKEPPPPPTPLAVKCRQFERFCAHSQVAGLFEIDHVPMGVTPIYDLGGGEKDIITIENGKPKHLKTEITKFQPQLQDKLGEEDLLACLLIAARLAEPTDYVNEYATSGGWASLGGNRLENRMHTNIYVKDFPRTLLFCAPEYTGLICESSDGTNVGYGFFMLLEKVRVVREY